MTTENQSKLNIAFQNIAGISGKELEIGLFLEKFCVDIFCVNEHWLKNYELSVFNIEHYNAVSSFCRTTTIRGGSAIYVKSDLKSKERSDISNRSIEGVIEISCIELEKYIVVCVYRPPYDAKFNEFEMILEDVLVSCCKYKKSVIVNGDYNVNILEHSTYVGRLLNLFKSFDLSNVFQEPTRITETSATCIDNVFCNVEISEKRILSCLKSDHCGLIITIPRFNKVKTEARRYKMRSIGTKNMDRFRNNLTKKFSKFDLISANVDVNLAYTSFFSTFNNLFNDSFPQKLKIEKNKLKFNHWASTELRLNRDKLYSLYEYKNCSRDVKVNDIISNFSKKFKKSCYFAKSEFIRNKIKNSDNKIKTIWSIVNNEIGKTVSRAEKSMQITGINGLTKCEKEIAEIFESHFSEIPITTTRGLNSSSVDALALLRVNTCVCDNSFSFNSVTSLDIIKTFKSLNLKKTEDLWGMSVDTISNFIDIMAPFLSYIFSKSIEQGTYPDEMKTSKVVPLFKSGSKFDPSNYRPISILPVLSKIFEKIILQQLINHFSKNDILHKRQFGFTKGRSTVDAGICLLGHIYDAWERSLNALGVFCDLSKAFDCVEHSTLLGKLEHYGIRNNALKLLKSYLLNRNQIIDIEGTKSEGFNLRMGVPQGSILGPFLFLIYVNDLPFAAEKFAEVVLFADDTSFIFKVKRNSNNDDTEINNNLSYLYEWFRINNLSLNSNKTKCIEFVLPNVRHVERNISFKLEQLDFIDSARFLGITLDSKLQWGAHIETLSYRLSSAIYAIRKIRKLTDVPTARLVYFSYFHSLLSYGLILWGSAADINAVFLLQKRAIRAIYGLRRFDSLRDRFKKINIMTVTCEYIYQIIMYVRRNIHNFAKNNEKHDYNTRIRNKLSVPLFRLSKVNKSFLGICTSIYNKIPDDIANLNLIKFKKYVKIKLIKKGYYCLNDYFSDEIVWS